MANLPQTRILEDAADCFKRARQGIYEGAALLYRIEAENAWEGHFGSFNEYIETKCQLSKGYVSRLLAAYRYYVIENGVSPRNLEGIDHEKAYLAISLKGSAREKLVRAEQWSRQEIRDELNATDEGDCTHPDIIQICARCKKRV